MFDLIRKLSNRLRLILAGIPWRQVLEVFLDAIPLFIYAVASIAYVFGVQNLLGTCGDLQLLLYLGVAVIWSIGLLFFPALKWRFPNSSRWMRSFLGTIGATLLFFFLIGPMWAMAEQAAHYLQLLRGGYGDMGSWYFYTDDSGMGNGRGLGGIMDMTAGALYAGFLTSIVWIPLSLFLSFWNDHFLRLLTWIFRAKSS